MMGLIKEVEYDGKRKCFIISKQQLNKHFNIKKKHEVE